MPQLSMFGAAFSQKWTRAALLIALVGGPALFAEEGVRDRSVAVETGITKPADLKPRELRFKSLGVIKTVDVKEGDVIKADQVLMAQDDSEEQAELDILKKDATDVRIRVAKVTKVVKEADLKRYQKIHNTGAENEAEVEKAQAEVDVAELTI